MDVSFMVSGCIITCVGTPFYMCYVIKEGSRDQTEQRKRVARNRMDSLLNNGGFAVLCLRAFIQVLSSFPSLDDIRSYYSYVTLYEGYNNLDDIFYLFLHTYFRLF